MRDVHDIARELEVAMNHPDPSRHTESRPTIRSQPDADLEPFGDLVAPVALTPQPNQAVRFFALGSILLAGLLGGLIGYGTTDLMVPNSPVAAALGLLVGAVGCAIGVGIVARLAIQAMGEWQQATHPEAQNKATGEGADPSPPR